MNSVRPRVCFLTGSANDWGGASRVLYTTLRFIDLSRIDPLVLLSGEGPIQADLERRGIRCIAWGPATEPTSKRAYLRALLKALRLFRRERIRALHVNHRFWRPAEVLAALLLRIPVLVHFHVLNRQEGSLMDRCRAAVCVSCYVARESLPEKLEKEVVYNPVDLGRFDRGVDLRSEWGLGPDTIVVAFLGQIREIKGVADFFAMAHRITHSHVCFLIAGECRDPAMYPGSYSEADLRAMADGESRIRYVGYRADVENVYHSADVVVVPSRWQEPLGLICLEAGACRKPVVATRVGGIPEIIEDGVNGHLVAAEDVDALTSRVEALVADTAARKRMGEAGRARVEDHFATGPIRAFEALLLRHACHNR